MTHPVRAQIEFGTRRSGFRGTVAIPVDKRTHVPSRAGQRLIAVSLIAELRLGFDLNTKTARLKQHADRERYSAVKKKCIC